MRVSTTVLALLGYTSAQDFLYRQTVSTPGEIDTPLPLEDPKYNDTTHDNSTMIEIAPGIIVSGNVTIVHYTNIDNSEDHSTDNGTGIEENYNNDDSTMTIDDNTTDDAEVYT
jgi:hypothetical protein